MQREEHIAQTLKVRLANIVALEEVACAAGLSRIPPGREIETAQRIGYVIVGSSNGTAVIQVDPNRRGKPVDPCELASVRFERRLVRGTNHAFVSAMLLSHALNVALRLFFKLGVFAGNQSFVLGCEFRCWVVQLVGERHSVPDTGRSQVEEADAACPSDQISHVVKHRDADEADHEIRLEPVEKRSSSLNCW